MFSTDFIFRQQENLVDNQKCQAGFRPLCNKILFHHSFQYALLSIVVMLVVFAIKEGHWDSIEEMNEVRNVAKMHSVFTMLFMVLVMIWKIILPDLKIIFTSPSEESKTNIETGEKTDIENPPPTYSEVLEITIENPPPNYSEVAQITINDIENVTLENVPLENLPLENVPLENVSRQEVAEILASLKMLNPPPKYSEAPQN